MWPWLLQCFLVRHTWLMEQWDTAAIMTIAQPWEKGSLDSPSSPLLGLWVEEITNLTWSKP